MKVSVRLQGWWKLKKKKLEKRIFEEAKGLGGGKLDYLSSFSVTDNVIIKVMLLTDNNMF